MRTHQQISLQLKLSYEELGKAYWDVFFFHMTLEERCRVYKLPTSVKLIKISCSGSVQRFQKRHMVTGHRFLWKLKAASPEAGEYNCCDLVHVQLWHFKFTALCCYWGCYKRIYSKNNLSKSDASILAVGRRAILSALGFIKGTELN